MPQHRYPSVVAAVIAAVAAAVAGTGSAAETKTPDVQLLHVQGNVYMLTGLDANVTVQVGSDGLLFVDTPPAALVPESVDLLRSLSTRPVRYIINTHLDAAHVGGDEALTRLGAAGEGLQGGVIGRAPPVAAGGLVGGVTVLGHENVLNRLTARQAKPVPGALVTAEYFQPTKDFFMNGDPIVVYHMPNAHTDGDSIVHFRRSDVISAGDIFTPGRFPEIDLERGGSIQGLIKAVNFILQLTVPAAFQEGGTYVVPGHGRLCDEADVNEFREMITVVRDRVADLIAQGKTLAQVQAARPALDYDTTYGGVHGGPTATEFVAAVYQSLTAPAAGATP